MRHIGFALVGLVAVTAFLLAAGSFPAPASAASFTVDSTADTVDAVPGDGVCADAGGNCTLRAAIQEANALIGTDTITVPSGTYNLSIGGTGEDAAATGDLDITDDLTITQSGGPSVPWIHGQGIDRVLDIDPSASGITVSLNALVISHGSEPTAWGGAGIWNRGTLTLTWVTVDNNTAGAAAGIRNDGTLTITNSNVFHNTAVIGGGGGIFNTSLGTLTLIDSVVWENTASLAGGGIHSTGTATIANSTISGNSSELSGGGIVSDGGPNTLNNVTITGNTADSDGDTLGDGGGVVASAGVLNVKNTIIAGNTDSSPGAEAPDCSGTLTSQDYNLIQNTAGCTISGATTNNITGVSANLGPLADNGGGTLTHALLAGSPAIDAGSPTTCEATDQRGVTRPQGAACDIGAYEAAAPTPTPTPTPTPDCPQFPPGETHVVDLQLCFDDIRLDLDQDPNCTLEYSSGPVCFTGPGTIWRSDPYRSGGYCTIDKKMKSASLTATLAGHLTTMIFGSEQGLPQSTGTIVSLSPVPGPEFPADNDWEVHFKIGGLPTGELQNCDLDLDGTPDPATLEAIIWRIPPYGALHLGSVDLGGVISACDQGGTVRAEGEDAKGEVSPPVGGAVETLDGSGGPDSSVYSSSGSGFNYTALGGALAVAVVAVAAGAWFARRRWAR